MPRVVDENLLAIARRLRASAPIRAWAMLPGSLTDRRKVDSELAGIRKMTPSSEWAKQIVALARLAYDPPAPAQNHSLSPIWRLNGVFTRSLSSFSTRDEAFQAGFRWIAVQLDRVPYAADNERELALIRPGLEAKGWRICGWADAGHGTDPTDDALRAASIVRRLRLDGWLAGMESWAEGEYRWKTSSFVRAWQGAGAPCPLAASCSSSKTGNYRRDFDYEPFLSLPGSAISPQTYGATDPGFTVEAMEMTMARAAIPLGRLAPTFDVVAGVGPFPDYGTWDGPMSVWTGDDARTTTWASLKRTA